MMADFEKSQLVIIDIQEKLAAAMPKEVINKLVKRCELLVTTASEFGVPFICSEQYPKGLGPTLSSMQSFLGDAKFVEKVAFNCVDEPVFERCLVKSRPQIFIMGMEAHICVLQTALSLLDKGKDVFIVEDAIVSRNILNKQNAINRLRQAGCIITTTESVVFEWIKSADNEVFKKVAGLIKDID